MDQMSKKAEVEVPSLEHLECIPFLNSLPFHLLWAVQPSAVLFPASSLGEDPNIHLALQ